ncbi:MAG: rRNA maturation RNase YbeY [Steroidobacteraceae bacterium]
MPAHGPLELDVMYAARRPWAPRRAQFAAWAGAALSGAAPRPTPPAAGARTSLSILVVGAARSRSLNLRWRNRDRPTNVLSFNGAGLSPDGRRLLGELVICAPVVAHEAKAQGKTAAAHWAHMTVHGVLHLLGFGHERSAEAGKMEATEIQILDRLGFSDPYA